MIDTHDCATQFDKSDDDDNDDDMFSTIIDDSDDERLFKLKILNAKSTNGLIETLMFNYLIEDQYARSLAMRAIFLKNLYKTSSGSGGGQFMNYVKQNFDLAMNSCDRTDALIMLEYAKFNSERMKQYDLSFLQFFRAAKLFPRDDLLRVKSLLLSAMDFERLCLVKGETRENEAEILKDLLSEWHSGHDGQQQQQQQDVKEETSANKKRGAVVSWLVNRARKEQEWIEGELQSKFTEVYGHFTTKNRIRQIQELYQSFEASK